MKEIMCSAAHLKAENSMHHYFAKQGKQSMWRLGLRSPYKICVDIKEMSVLDVRDTSHRRRDMSLDFPWNIYDEQTWEREFHKLRNLKQKQIRWTPKLTKKKRKQLNLVCFSFVSLLRLFIQHIRKFSSNWKLVGWLMCGTVRPKLIYIFDYCPWNDFCPEIEEIKAMIKIERWIIHLLFPFEIPTPQPASITTF